MDLTKKQLKTLSFISTYCQMHGGLSPTFREIVKGTGVSDIKSAHRIIEKLIKSGYLIKSEGKARSIVLTNQGIEFLNTPVSAYLKEYFGTAHISQPAEYSRNDVTPVTAHFDSPNYDTGNTVKTDGTSSDNEINLIIESLSQVLLGIGKNSTSSTVITDVLSESSLLKRLTWLIFIPTATWIYMKAGLSTTISVLLSILLSLLIKYFIKE